MGHKRRINSYHGVEAVIRFALKRILGRLLNIETSMPREIAELKPPYLLLANHQGFWDPFIAGMYLKGSIFYITSDAVFRSRLFGFLLKFMGAVPKTKAQSDIDALKNIFEIKERGGSIGIFPEGQRTWDGCTLPVIKSTSKLVRMLKLPVVVAIFKGGFFSQPRWGMSIRKGKLRVDYRLLFDGEECASMKISDIHTALTAALSHDEIDYQKKAKIRFTGDRYAENIEQFIFCCPECEETSGFSSDGPDFICTSCGKKWHIDDYQDISPVNGEKGFDNLRDWNSWQMEHLRKRLDRDYGTDKRLLKGENAVFHTGYKSRRLKKLSSGSLNLYSDALVMNDSMGREVLKAPLNEISGINVQNREVLDFYHKGTLYTVSDKKRRFCSYKFVNAVDYLQREKLKLNIPT